MAKERSWRGLQRARVRVVGFGETIVWLGQVWQAIGRWIEVVEAGRGGNGYGCWMWVRGMRVVGVLRARDS